MIGYLYLSLALFAGITKGFCGKKVSGSMQNFKDCLFINAVRMLFCTLIGIVFVVIDGDWSFYQLSFDRLGVYLLSAFGMSIFCVCWMYAYKQDAYVFLNIFTMLSSIITCFLSVIVYRETVQWNEWVGIAILLFAVICMSKYNEGLKGKLSWKSWLILIIGCSGCAVADFSQKIFVTSINGSVATFNFFTYAFGLALLLITYGIAFGFNSQKKMVKITSNLKDKRYIFAYFAMSLFLFLNTTFKTMAARWLSSAQIYPVLQGANLILSGLMAHFIFKEKLNSRAIIGMVCAFSGLIFMNVL